MADMEADKMPLSLDDAMRKAVELHRTGQLQAAEAIYRMILRKNPDHPDALNFLGVIAHQAGQNETAVALLRRALQIDPDAPHYHTNLGNAYRSLSQPEKALACYRRNLDLNPGDAVACHNLAVVSQNLGDTLRALRYYRRAFRLDPANSEACSHSLHLSMTFCDWRDLGEIGTRMNALTRRELSAGIKTGETPFHSVVRTAEPPVNHAVARSWSDDIRQRVSQYGVRFDFGDRSSKRHPLTLGYLSNDFRNHPVAHLTAGLFAAHDRKRFRVFGFSYGEDDGSSHRKRIVAGCDRFADVRDLDPYAAARKIRDDGVDILIDLMGHTKGGRLEICALRPAPVQVTYLGFPGTSGADFFDYIFTDAVVTPAGDMPFYSEAPVFLPHCYQVNDGRQAVAAHTVSRRDAGLPEKGFVFCSFNQAFKFEPVMFDTWMNILRRVPGSVLWLLTVNDRARENLARKARSRGISSERLVFANRLDKPGHLARLKLADLVLDTRVYNGHTSTSDALWVGVPVVTLIGRHFASRVSASILTAVGAPELITRTSEQYENLSVEMAVDSDRYRTVRKKIAENRTRSPLFDTDRFARNLETAYGVIWEQYISGRSPRGFSVLEGT